MALLATLRYGLPRRSVASALKWDNVDFAPQVRAPITARKSKQDQEAEGTVLYTGDHAAQALRAIKSRRSRRLNRESSAYPPSREAKCSGPRRRMPTQAKSSPDTLGKVGMAEDLVRSGAELPALMQAGRCISLAMPARFTERQAADRALWPDTTRKKGKETSD